MQKQFIVYVKMSASHRISIGVSYNMNNLNAGPSSTKAQLYQNGVRRAKKNDHGSKIVYYEIKKNKRVAISREKELNKLNRKRLRELIRTNNPELLDLSTIWKEENTYFSENALFLI